MATPRPDPRAREPQQLLDSVYLMEQSFEGISVRGAVIVGTKRALVFDTLYFPDETKLCSPIIAGKALLVVYSHADYDHIWGTSGLPSSEIIAHEECAKRFADEDDVQRTLSEFRSQHTSELSQIVLLPPNRTFSSRLELDLGGIHVDLSSRAITESCVWA